MLQISGYEVRWFSAEEFTDVTTMHVPLLLELDRLREYLGRPVRISESNPAWFPGTSHVEGSRHYIGRAVDCSCVGIPLWAFFLAASRFGFTGIGVYPYWNTPGLHLELVEEEPYRRYWWRDDSMQYRALQVGDLQRVFLSVPA